MDFSTCEREDCGARFERRPHKRYCSDRCRRIVANCRYRARLNAKALSTYMGHANITITLDLYGHLMPGNEGEAAELLNAYLEAERERSDEAARGSVGKPWEKAPSRGAVPSGP